MSSFLVDILRSNGQEENDIISCGNTVKKKKNRGMNTDNHNKDLQV